MLRAGDLKDRIEIQANTGSEAAADGSVTASWTTIATVRALIRPLSGQERIAQQAVKPTASHEVVIRPTRVTPEERIKVLARLIATANATANTLTLSGPVHNTVQADDCVRVETEGTIPGGLATLTDYYVVAASGVTVKLSASSGGSAIDLTSAGAGRLYLVVPRYFDIASVEALAPAALRLIVSEALQ